MADVDAALRSPRSPAPGQPDWADQTADTIERVVGQVRDKTTGPALKVIRALVYGLFATLVGIAALILLAIAAVRVIDVYLPSAVFGDEHTWAAHLIVGLAFVLVGGVMFARRGRGVEQKRAGKR